MSPVVMTAMRGDDNSVLSGANSTFVQELFARYVQNPASVDPSWQGFFAELSDDQRQGIIVGRGQDIVAALPAAKQALPTVREFHDLLMETNRPEGIDNR